MSALIDPRNIHTIRHDLYKVGLFILAIWIVFVLDRFLALEALGLKPRDLRGVPGIIAMPFLHVDLKHLLGNSVPLAVTLMLLAGSRANSSAIVILIVILSGAGLWLFGRNANHIGASGLVFGLITFHIFAGIFERVCSQSLLRLSSACFTHQPSSAAYCLFRKVSRGTVTCLEASPGFLLPSPLLVC